MSAVHSLLCIKYTTSTAEHLEGRHADCTAIALVLKRVPGYATQVDCSWAPSGALSCHCAATLWIAGMSIAVDCLGLYEYGNKSTVVCMITLGLPDPPVIHVMPCCVPCITWYMGPHFVVVEAQCSWHMSVAVVNSLRVLCCYV